MENSGIEWTDHTFNGWIGCTKVSEACKFCYAETNSDRFGHVEKWSRDRKYLSDQNWRKPVTWNKKSPQQKGRRTRIFCASMSDIFEQHPKVKPEWRDRLWALIEATPKLDWQLLTKRPENIMSMVPKDWAFDGFPPNVWMGTTVESQEMAEKRLPVLMEIPARIRFISAEPLLGPVDLTPWLSSSPTSQDPQHIKGRADGVQWVIAGGELASKARPMHPVWLRTMRDACASVTVPFFFKQWGSYCVFDITEGTTGSARHRIRPGFGGRRQHQIIGAMDGQFEPVTGDVRQHSSYQVGGAIAVRGSVALTGRKLDGCVHDEFPTTPFEVHSHAHVA